MKLLSRLRDHSAETSPANARQNRHSITYCSFETETSGVVATNEQDGCAHKSFYFSKPHDAPSHVIKNN